MSRPTNSVRAGLPRALGALFVALSASTALATGLEPAQSITVRVDHFTYESWSSRDVDTLALKMRAARPAWVELMACGPEASWALQTVAQRLSELPLQLQAVPLSAPACAGTSTAKHAIQGFESTADKAAVTHYIQGRRKHPLIKELEVITVEEDREFELITSEEELKRCGYEAEDNEDGGGERSDLGGSEPVLSTDGGSGLQF